MKKINIFVGSSIVDFKIERSELELFIRRISDDFEDKYEIKLVPFFCENVDDSMSKTRSQDEYNKLIENSSFCIFLFFNKAGQYTKEEYDIAYKNFIKNNNPKLLVYLKEIKDDNIEESLKNFIDELDNSYNQIYSTFDSLDTIKLRLLLNIKLMEKDFFNVSIRDNLLLIDDKKVFEIGNINEFMNNSNLIELKKSLDETNQKYLMLKELFEKDNSNKNIEEEYIEVSSKRNGLVEIINDLENDILNLSISFTEAFYKGEYSVRYKKAFKLFETGDLFGALAILDENDIDSEYYRTLRTNQYKIMLLIKENMYAIDLLMRCDDSNNVRDEINRRFILSVNAAIKYDVEYIAILKYSNYLISIGNDVESNKYLQIYNEKIGK